jgi:hypothetical protein
VGRAMKRIRLNGAHLRHRIFGHVVGRVVMSYEVWAVVNDMVRPSGEISGQVPWDPMGWVEAYQAGEGYYNGGEAGHEWAAW